MGWGGVGVINRSEEIIINHNGLEYIVSIGNLRIQL